MSALDGWNLTGPVAGLWHNYPVQDLREHALDGLTCWCRPTLDPESEGLLVVHNSADRREDYEVMGQ